jgi:undecaprenyl-diphosphatase
VNLPAAILLGIVQGLTEFLPVSSSAHLILARAFFGWEMPPEFGLAFDVALHVGTLAAIVLFFRTDVLAMIASTPAILSSQPGDSGRLVRDIVVGTIPVVIVGLLFNDFIEDVLRTPQVAAIALAIGATLMLLAERAGSRTRDERGITWLDAVLIGCAQASALIPGMSRSGTTIAIAMFLGFRREGAARFTFLLAIPAMLAAAAKETLELRHLTLGSDAVQLFVVGMVVSAVVGYLTIKYFLRFLVGNRLDIFAYYRYALAVCALGFFVARGA